MAYCLLLDYVSLFDLLMKNFISILTDLFVSKKNVFFKGFNNRNFIFCFCCCFLTTSFVTCVLVECDLFSDKKILEFLYFILLKYKNSFVVIVLIVLM